MTETKAWVKIGLLSQVPEGKAINVYINGQRLVITRHQDSAYVLQGYCTHMMFYFKDALVEDCVLTCGLHRSQFDVRDGSVVLWTENLSGKLLEDVKTKKRLRTYDTEVRDGIVYVLWTTADPDKVRVKF
jgi:nitrite reductase/ring-hydroxylating ferredoxin subunit